MPIDWEEAINEAVADIMDELEDWSLEALEKLVEVLGDYIISIKEDEK